MRDHQSIAHIAHHTTGERKPEVLYVLLMKIAFILHTELKYIPELEYIVVISLKE